MNLWQKIQAFYHYHWTNQDILFHEPIARPLWYMVHTQKQIEHRIATRQAKTAKQYKYLMEYMQSALETLKAEKNQ